MEWIAPADDEKFGFVKVAKYYYFPGWWEGGASGHVIVNMAKWNELPAAYKAVLTVGGPRGRFLVPGQVRLHQPAALKRLIGKARS